MARSGRSGWKYGTKRVIQDTHLHCALCHGSRRGLRRVAAASGRYIVPYRDGGTKKLAGFTSFNWNTVKCKLDFQSSIQIPTRHPSRSLATVALGCFLALQGGVYTLQQSPRLVRTCLDGMRSFMFKLAAIPTHLAAKHRHRTFTSTYLISVPLPLSFLSLLLLLLSCLVLVYLSLSSVLILASRFRCSAAHVSALPA